MASQTLVQAKKFITDDIVSGIVQDIIDINPIYASIPFTGYMGQAILTNRELALGDAGFYAVDATITNKAASTYTQVPFSAVKVIGDAEIDNLVTATSSSAGVNQLAIEISSKAKSIGRLVQGGIATGDGVAPNMNSLHSLVDSGQFTTASAGQALSFALMDEAMDLVKSKDGQTDWCMMAPRTMRSYKVLLRALGGTPADWVVTLPDGRTVISYEGVPIYKNEYLSVTETANGASLTTGALASVWFGNFDGGDMKTGISMIHPENTPAGVGVEFIGQLEAKDSSLVRIKQYVNLAVFSRKSISRLTSISN